jgi:hypothetical protein
MVNHPTRHRGPYTATIGGSSWRAGPQAEFKTIRECRRYAESYGTTADWCRIEDAKGREVGTHRRDTSHDGLRWFRSEG